MTTDEFLTTVSSTDIIRDWGELTHKAIVAQAAILVTNMRRPYLVVLPYDAYLALVAKAQTPPPETAA